MAKLAIFDTTGKQIDTLEMPDEIFSGDVKADIIHQAVVMYQACQRQGTAQIKERNDVSGGGKKPFRQKGTGQARQGSRRSPLHVGGGKVHGPQPHDFGYTLPKKIKMAALRETLKAKYKDQNIVCIDDLKSGMEKTKEFVQVLKALNIKGKVVAALDGSDESINRVSRNIRFFTLMRSQDVNAYDVMRNKNMLVTRTAMNNLLNRVTK